MPEPLEAQSLLLSYTEAIVSVSSRLFYGPFILLNVFKAWPSFKGFRLGIPYSSFEWSNLLSFRSLIASSLPAVVSDSLL